MATGKLFDQAWKQGFAGMLADDGYTDKITRPSESAVPFGVVVSETIATGTVKPGPGDLITGISIHDHSVVTFPFIPPAYGQWSSGAYQGYAAQWPVSILKRGRIWCACVDNAAFNNGDVVKFAADGRLDPAGANTLARAKIYGAPTRSPFGQTIVRIDMLDPKL